MRDHVLKSVRTLAAFLPMLALAQPMSAQREQRDGSFEFSAGVGVMYLDGALASSLTSRGYGTNGEKVSRLDPALALRLGYNINSHIGVSIGTAGATGSGVKYLIPFAAITFTGNLNAPTSPFLTVGTQFTRITGNNGVDHPTWGAHFGVGVRHMMSEYLALRLEGRLGVEHYEDLPGRKTAYNSVITLGFSYFTEGRRAPAATPCPICQLQRTRVDTVRIEAPVLPAVVHNCEHGIAPVGAQTDSFGCIILGDTLLLEQVHFDFDKSDITPTALPILDRVAESMNAHPEMYFEIAGHTDSVGTFAYNFLLSARRARAVRDYLIKQGVAAYRMTAVGYGEGLPIAPNATVEGRALNRRGIEIRVKKP
jgi:outer membrane protein OmpA-like peptidoglycan-associated protein